MKKTQTFIAMVLGTLAVFSLIGISFHAFGKNVPEQSKPQDTASVSRGSEPSANDVTFTLLDGGTLSLGDYRGKKPVILDFFATWCPNCQRNTPHLSELYKTYGDRVQVIGVNLHEDPSVVRQFMTSYHIGFPLALDPDGFLAQHFDVRYTNVHVFIDRAGNILRTVPGDVEERDIQSLL